MITRQFDIISDLNLENLNNFSWENKATSLFCIIAGNITQHRSVLFEFLNNIKEHYKLVFFIDGELEHTPYKGDFVSSYINLEEGIREIEKVVFLHENIIVLNETTVIMGSNGWTTFDFTNKSTVTDTIDFLAKNDILQEQYANEVFKLAVSDQHYLSTSIDTCQEMQDCTEIIIVTNTVPKTEFITHNDEFYGTHLGDVIGNNGIVHCLESDIGHKVNTWVFGKFPEELDYTIDNIRYINNPMQDKELDMYFPKRIDV